MKIKLQKKGSAGFAIIEVFLGLLIVVVIAGLTILYFTQQNKIAATVNTIPDTPTVLTQITAPSGTTDNINQILQQALESEKNIDTSIDSSILDNATSTNSAITNIGGAYDASNL
ncbi:MAG: hypothetical protein WCH58_02320 [Candidatus Saccharibacteria bacterium]|jgi:predicted PurR-regulated permease PerM